MRLLVADRNRAPLVSGLRVRVYEFTPFGPLILAVCICWSMLAFGFGSIRQRALLWTSQAGCGASASKSMRLLYDPAEHRPLASRFGQDIRVVILSNRSWAVWVLGYPDAAIADSERALKDAREIGQAATLMYALLWSSWAHNRCGNYITANELADELVALADESGSLNWEAYGIISQGCVSANNGQSSHAVERITSALRFFQSTRSTLFVSSSLLYLAKAHAQLDQFNEARRYIDEAINAVQINKEWWCEAEVHRVAGEVALQLPERDAAAEAEAEAYFERALAVARQQQAKSWELRAATSFARLWRSQGKVSEARELLAPVYGWFTEGFDTRDLKDAKALLEELAA
jgi:predicted ATPase